MGKKKIKDTCTRLCGRKNAYKERSHTLKGRVEDVKEKNREVTRPNS